jgi:ABC-type lipoprotein export system ATPase subunit/GNAT superfamily N-acetyltransferase
MAEIKLVSEIKNDDYTQYVYDKFDIQDSSKTEVVVNYDFTPIKGKKWNIGVVYGSSGCGKTTILKSLGKLNSVDFDREKALISNFDFMSPDDAATVLMSMGLSSVPTWLRPFSALSNGEQYRAELAYKVAKAGKDEIILIDEYTSVVDRDVAKAMSFALQKYIRKTGKKIVLASCHYDIMDWLTPDWTCSPQRGGVLVEHDCLRQSRPEIKLQVSRVEHGAWDLFKKHHYLTENVNKSCKFFLFTWDDRPVGMVAAINQPGAGDRRNAMALSRTVVLPDFQGLGIGKAISSFTASMLTSEGRKIYMKTIHPALGEYRERSDDYRPTAANGKIGAEDKMVKRKMRVSYCHQYVGEPTFGYDELTKTVGEMRANKKKNSPQLDLGL